MPGWKFYGSKHFRFSWSSWILLTVPLSAQEDPRRRGEIVGHTIVKLWLLSSMFWMASSGRRWCIGGFLCVGKPCCWFQGSESKERAGKLTVMTLTALEVSVTGISSCSYMALIVNAYYAPAGRRESIWDSKMAATLDNEGSSRLCPVFLPLSKLLSSNTPWQGYILWEIHLHQKKNTIISVNRMQVIPLHSWVGGISEASITKTTKTASF